MSDSFASPRNIRSSLDSVHGISSFSSVSSWLRDWTHISCAGRQILYHCTTREASQAYKCSFKGIYLTLHPFVANVCPPSFSKYQFCGKTSRWDLRGSRDDQAILALQKLLIQQKREEFVLMELRAWVRSTNICSDVSHHRITIYKTENSGPLTPPPALFSPGLQDTTLHPGLSLSVSFTPCFLYC